MMLALALFVTVATALPDWLTGGLKSGCTHVCTKDDCRYTFTNPLRKDKQYEIKQKKWSPKGCCKGGKSECDLCCVPGTGEEFHNIRSIEEGDMFRLESNGEVRLVEDSSRAAECVTQVGAPVAMAGAAAMTFVGVAWMVVNRKKQNQYTEIDTQLLA